ncbi:MAG: toll/interleukin-1 receptor domain-containing protein, partial [Bryobacteraceae bacterium]
MGHIEKTAFISYRHTNASWALAIFQNLTHHGYDVFFDFNGIASGDFESVILENIRARAHFLVLLTPSALERCSEPEDWLRREIETALNIQRNIVPIMLEGFDFGSPGIAGQLTGTLASLKNYNALPVPVAYFSEAMNRLREKYLNVPLDAVLHPVSPPVQRGTSHQQAAAVKAPAVPAKDLTASEWFERGFNATDLEEQVHFYGQAIRLKPDLAEAYV